MTVISLVQHQLTDRDPNEVVRVDAACEFLGISRPTLYRLDGLRRVRLSPGRVGYRISDLLEHARRGDRPTNVGPVVGITNTWVVDRDELLLPDWFLDLPPRVSTIVRRRSRAPAGEQTLIGAGASYRFAAELPPARDWVRLGHRELVFVDYDGANVSEPMVIVASEDEQIDRKARLMVTQPHATVRLLPSFGWPEKLSDGWFVG